MQVLILSDIHANLEALEACLAAAPPYDLALNLGDLVGYGANPNEVTERSRKLGRIFVRGNHDKVCTGIDSIENFNPIAAQAVLWTRQELSDDNMEFLRELPRGPVRPEEVAGVECVHGSPLDEDDYLVVIRDAIEPLRAAQLPLTFFGHTHIQGGFSMDGERWETLRPRYESSEGAQQDRMELREGVVYMINPGSVGQPRDGDWRAAFALYDSDARSVTFHRVPYEVERAQQKIFAAQLPERLALRLSEGR